MSTDEPGDGAWGALEDDDDAPYPQRKPISPMTTNNKEIIMNFGQAIEALKAGQFVQRKGWNGKNMHLYLEDGLSQTIGAGVFKGLRRSYAPCICMFTAQGTHQPGWLASQPDMLADDWQIVEHP